MDQTEFKPIRRACPIRSKERRAMAHVHRLPGLEQDHSQKQLSSAEGRRAHGQTTWSAVLHEAGPLLRIPPDQTEGGGHPEDRLRDEVWSLRVSGHAIWTL